MMIKEWFCSEHGDFEGSHAICPAIGCRSAEVIRVFHTAPKVGSAQTRATDRSVKRTADMYNLPDIRTAREGEASKANSRHDQVLWGDSAEKFIGRPLNTAHTPQTYEVKTDQGVQRWTDRGGMVEAANMGITHSKLPPAAEKMGHMGDRKP